MSSPVSLGPKSSDPSQALPFKLFDLQPSLESPVSRFYAEDGWIFREYPGKGIEIVCRYEPPTAAAQSQDDPGP